MKHKEYLEKQRRNPEYVAAEKELQPILDIADDVLRLRLEKGWSQADLAERVGTKQANISRLENGLANPSIEFLQKIAKAFDMGLVIRFGPEVAERKVIFVYEIRQDAVHLTPPIYSTANLSPSEPYGYEASLTNFAVDRQTKSERVAL
jgi:transcriptional regulator with XRE-family HTH domain